MRTLALLLACLTCLAADRAISAPDSLANLERRIDQARRAGRSDRALPFANQHEKLSRDTYGSLSSEYARSVTRIGEILQDLGKLDEAERKFRAALSVRENTNERNAEQLSDSLIHLGQVLELKGERPAKFISYYRRAWDNEYSSRRYGRAASFIRHRLLILYLNIGRTDEAIDVQLQALDVRKDSPADAEFADILGDLGAAYHEAGRREQAGKIYKRQLEVQEKVLPKDHLDIGVTLSNLGAIALSEGDSDDARKFYERCLRIRKMHLDPRHPTLAMAYDNIGEVLAAGGDYRNAETNYRMALQINLAAKKLDAIAVNLSHLARLMATQGRYADAIEFHKASIEVHKSRFGERHPEVADAFAELARVYGKLGRWAEAEKTNAIAVEIYLERARTGVLSKTGSARRELKLASDVFLFGVLALSFLPQSHDSLERSFLYAQWALQSEADLALGQFADRIRAGSGDVAAIMRAHQDAQLERMSTEDRLIQAVTANAASAQRAEEGRLRELDSRLADYAGRLEKTDAKFAKLYNSKPLSVVDAQALLRDDEIVVLVAARPIDGFGETIFVWTVGKNQKDLSWRRADMDLPNLETMVQQLRCTLDRSNWTSDSSSQECLKLGIRIPQSRSERPRFPAESALLIHQKLLAPIATKLDGKTMIFVPSGPLASLPPSVLLKSSPPEGASYQHYDWLLRSQSMTVLPSVPALLALRSLQEGLTDRSEEASSRNYLGFGNPLLDGNDDLRSDRRAAALRTECTNVPALFGRPSESVDRTASVRGPTQRLLRREGSIVDSIKAFPPLPDTAQEVCTLAQMLGANSSNVFLAGRASKRQLFALNDTNSLQNYRILHFATHGLLSMEVAELQSQVEPALLLSPGDIEKSKDDNGLLGASEILKLRLNADVVILSACNTAAANGFDPEPLSGLARAFFYAGARSLLVSHWYVDSVASVKLVSALFAKWTEARDKGLSEALRLAQLEFLKNEPQGAHPSIWAAYDFVGIRPR